MAAGKRRVGLIVALAAALAAAGGAAGYVVLGRRPAAAAAPETRLYTVAKVELTELVSVDGNLEPIQVRDLTFAGGGTVAEIAVSEGARVERGQLIARLEDSAERYALAAVEQSIEEQRLAGAARRIALLELEREVKRAALRDARIEAPFAGIVSSVDVDNGQTVSASTRIARLIDRSALTAEVEVDELDAPRLRPGQEVRFHFESLPDLDLRGVVASVPVEARVTDAGVAVVDAELRLDSPPPQVLPGYSFTADIVVTPAREILVVDKKALLERNGRLIAFRAGEPGQPPARQPVEARDLGDGRYEIVGGLAEGDRLLAPPSTAARTGQSSTAAPANPLGIFGIPGGRLPAGGGPGLREGAPRTGGARASGGGGAR